MIGALHAEEKRHDKATDRLLLRGIAAAP